jgi:hypothetical protein
MSLRHFWDHCVTADSTVIRCAVCSMQLSQVVLLLAMYHKDKQQHNPDSYMLHSAHPLNVEHDKHLPGWSLIRQLRGGSPASLQGQPFAVLDQCAVQVQ